MKISLSYTLFWMGFVVLSLLLLLVFRKKEWNGYFTVRLFVCLLGISSFLFLLFGVLSLGFPENISNTIILYLWAVILSFAFLVQACGNLIFLKGEKEIHREYNWKERVLRYILKERLVAKPSNWVITG